MAHDPIIEEVRRIREEIAREHGCDVKAIVRALQQDESKSGREFVTLPPKRISTTPPAHEPG